MDLQLLMDEVGWLCQTLSSGILCLDRGDLKKVAQSTSQILINTAFTLHTDGFAGSAQIQTN